MLNFRRGMLTDGDFGWSGRSGMMLADGYFWARRSGGYNFYLGVTGERGIDFEHPMAACGPDRDDLTFSGPFPADSDYWLAVKAVSGFGLESEGYAWIRVRTDDDGNGDARPAPVQNLRAGIGWNGRIILEWEYPLRPGWPVPSTFKIYGGVGSIGVDFSTPLQGLGGDVQVSCRPGRWQYVWDNLDDPIGTGPWKLAVRAETADGVDDGSQRYVVAMGDLVGPGSLEEFNVEQIDV
jgi:hypothetical protein